MKMLNKIIYKSDDTTNSIYMKNKQISKLYTVQHKHAFNCESLLTMKCE